MNSDVTKVIEIKFEGLELYTKKKVTGSEEYHLVIKYLNEDDCKISSIKYDIVLNDYNLFLLPHIEQNIVDTCGHFNKYEYSIDFGFGAIKPSNLEVIKEVVEYKTKEMTIEEIEKELGHKVKIVGDK